MNLLGIAIVCALVFLICFAVDRLIQKLFPKTELEKGKNVVRPARRSAVFGIILTFASVALAVFRLGKSTDTLLLIGCAVAFVLGVILLVTYFSFAIYYDQEKFLYCSHGKKQEFRYAQIRGQRTLMTRGGYNSILFVGDAEINLYSSMQNVNVFLGKAFYRWCEQKGIDPGNVENNPRMMAWFPDPDTQKNEN